MSGFSAFDTIIFNRKKAKTQPVIKGQIPGKHSKVQRQRWAWTFLITLLIICLTSQTVSLVFSLLFMLSNWLNKCMRIKSSHCARLIYFNYSFQGANNIVWACLGFSGKLLFIFDSFCSVAHRRRTVHVWISVSGRKCGLFEKSARVPFFGMHVNKVK